MKVIVEKACSHADLRRLVQHYKHWGYEVTVYVVDSGYEVHYFMPGGGRG